MNQIQKLSLLALRRLRNRVAVTTGSWSGGDDVVEFAGEGHLPGLLDDRDAMARSLRRAVRHAWLTLELILEKDRAAPRLSQSGQEILGGLVSNRCFDYLASMPARIRQSVTRDLHAARTAGPLLQGDIDVTGLISATDRPQNDEQLQDAEWQSLLDLSDELTRGGYGGMRSLVEARYEGGESLIIGLLLSFLPFELEAEGARFDTDEISALPTDQVLWIIEQSEPFEELLDELNPPPPANKPAAPPAEPPPAAPESAENAARVRQGLGHLQRGDYERAAVEFTAALHNGQARPQVYVHRGDAYRLRGDYDRAVSDYGAALRLDPNHVLAYVNRAIVQRLLGRAEAAIADYTEALRLDPRNVFAYNGRGAAHADLSQFDRAVADHTQALRLDPALAWAHQSRGDAYAGLGDYDLAIADYSHALRLNPHLPLAYANRGDAYRLKGDLDRSIADYTEALRLDPHNPRIFTNRGESYRRKGELDRALADFGEAIRVDPTNPAVYLSRGIAYQLAGEHDRAVADFDRAEQFDSANPEVFYQRALTYQKEGSYDNAMSDLARAIELNPRDVAAYMSRGSLRAIITNYEGAIEDFTEAIRLDPRSAQARLERGRIHAQMGSFDAALDDCASAIQIDAQFVPAYVIRGGAYVRLNDFERAINEFNEALRINPRYAKAYNDRGVAYSKLERLDEAVADFSRALQYAPDYVQALANRANAFQLLKQPERALRDFTRAVQIDGRYAAVYCVQRGVVEAAKRRYDLALADFAVALVIDPDSIAAQRGIVETQKQRESDFDYDAASDGPAKAPQHQLTPVQQAPTSGQTTQAALPAVGGSQAPATQLALPAVRSEYEIDLAQPGVSVEEPIEGVVVDGSPLEQTDADANAADAEYVANAAVEIEEETVTPKAPIFPEQQTIEQKIQQTKLLAEEAKRRFEQNKLKADQARKKQKQNEDPEERTERFKRYKQYVMIGIGAIVLGYWAVQLVVALLPPPKNPFDEYPADQFLQEYVKNKVAADEKFADKMISVRGKVVVERDKRKRGAPRVFAAASTEGIRIEYLINDEDTLFSMKDGEEYLIAGKVQPFQPGKGIIFADAHIRVDPKKKGQADFPGPAFAYFKK